MKMPGEVTFTPSEADYVAAISLQFIRQLQAAKFWRRVGLLALVAVAFVALAAGLAGDDWLQGAITGGVGALGGIVGLAIIIGGNFLLLPRRSRRLFRQQRSLHRETTFEWSAVGSRWTSNRGETQTDWADYHRWTEGRAVTLLYLNDNFMQFLPRRAFAAAQLDDLRATLTDAKVPTK